MAASIISTIQDRKYVEQLDRSFRPTDLGTVVTDKLVRHFPKVFDVRFTAHMEDELDMVEQAQADWVGVLEEFYGPFSENLKKAGENMVHAKAETQPSEYKCESCGKEMVYRFSKNGRYLACTGYPDCKFTKSFQKKTGATCPQCGGELVERRSKKGRTFYGCSNYPGCNFAVFSRPLPEPCPRCAALMTEYRGNQARCTKCSYRGKIPQE